MKITGWLDFIGIPWRLTREELARKFGISPHPAYGWEIIPISLPKPPLSGLIAPIHVLAFNTFSPRFPATEFVGVTHFGDDANLNIERTATELAQYLGPTRISGEYNVVTCRWDCGRSKIKLTAWPRDKQPSDFDANPAHKRDPRLQDGCLLTINSGYLPEPSEIEAEWMETLQPIGTPNIRTPDFLYERDPPQTELEFIREPRNSSRTEGRIGVSGDRKGLIAHGEYLYVFDTREIASLILQRVLPAKGSGGSFLSINCPSNYPGGPGMKSVTVASANGPDELTELAELVAKAVEKPLEVPAYDYDA